MPRRQLLQRSLLLRRQAQSNTISIAGYPNFWVACFAIMVHMSDIFVSVASYRDPELESTLRDLIDKAEKPGRIHVGIVYQGTERERPSFDFLPKYSLISMHPREARGVGFARSKAMSLYQGETYFLQIDSHMRFVQNWDRLVIDQLQKAQSLTKNKVILSSFAAPYSLEGNRTIIHTKKVGELAVHPTKQKVFLRKSNEWGAERVEFENPDRPMPEESNTILAGFVFTYGEIVNEIPYDPEISFFGEEICFAARAWTRGWDIYSPSIVLAYHFYQRGGFRKVWNDNNIRTISWSELQQISYAKQKRVLCGIEKGQMGLGDLRTIEAYESMVGFSFKEFYSIEK